MHITQFCKHNTNATIMSKTFAQNIACTNINLTNIISIVWNCVNRVVLNIINIMNTVCTTTANNICK